MCVCVYRQKSLDEAVLLPTGKGFALTSDLNLRQALLDGYECHIRESPSSNQKPDSDSDPGEQQQHETNDDDEERERERTKKRRKFVLPKLKIAAMTNDTVATFASLAYGTKASCLRHSSSSNHNRGIGAYSNSRVVMGLMIGAGCNATVPMKVSRLHASKTEFITRASSSEHTQPNTNNGNDIETLVSTEWTLLRSSQPLLDMDLMTRWDKQISAHSQPPGFQPMEYMVGGRYLGELTRLIVLEYFTSVLQYPSDVLPWRLKESDGLTTEFLSLNVAAAPEGEEEGERLAAELNKRLPSTKGWTWNAEKAGILKTVAYAVQSRSTAIIAAATVGLLACTGEIRLRNPDDDNNENNNDTNDDNTDAKKQSYPHNESNNNDNENPPKPAMKWNTPEELIVAFSGGVIQNYPRYKESLQRHIDRLLVHGGPQQGGKSILLREVRDGGIIGVGVLAGCAMMIREGGIQIEGIVGSRLV